MLYPFGLACYALGIVQAGMLKPHWKLQSPSHNRMRICAFDLVEHAQGNPNQIRSEGVSLRAS